MTSYTELELRKLKGQALKDVWHTMIGKETGIKNTTGFKNTEEILQAILKGQQDPTFLQSYLVKSRHKAAEQVSVVEEMPKPEIPTGEKKKRGPKPKSNPNPIVIPQTPKTLVIQAVESKEAPIQVVNVERMRLRKLHIDNTIVFLDVDQQKVYEMVNNRPGNCVGTWNAETRRIAYDS